MVNILNYDVGRTGLGGKFAFHMVWKAKESFILNIWVNARQRNISF